MGPTPGRMPSPTDEGGTAGARAHAMCPKCAHDGGLEHEESPGALRDYGADLGFCLEPPGGIEPTTYPLRARFGGSSTGGPPALTCAFVLIQTS